VEREGVEMEAIGIVGHGWFHQCNAELEDVACNVEMGLFVVVTN
jgi:hypothetical protein